MAFVVETGTGDPNATAYVDESFADTYHSDRKHDSWTGASADKQAAIIRATDHIDRLFGQWFRGRRRQKDQALEWPRIGAFDDDDFAMTSVDEIPRALKKACAEYALRALLIGNLTPDGPSPVPLQDLETATSGQQAQAPGSAVVKEQVGPIVTEFAKPNFPDPTAPNLSGVNSVGLLPQYPAADMYLQELLIPRGVITLRRA